jgi:ABC-2 type transport system ATP-binding protein
MEPAIKTSHLRKEYDKVIALSALDLEIPEGEICGLIGPNGAGKSTLLKILSTVIRPDFGLASVSGFGVETNVLEVRRRVGFMPDFFALYENMTSEDFLVYFALAYGMPPDKIKPRVDELLALVNLTDKRNEMISGLSRGMKQRLVFVKTLIHDPPVLLLDEPLSGLDPKARIEMRESLRSLKKMGKTIIVSSHILAELSDFCSYVVILEKGILRANGTVSQILDQIQGALQVAIEVTNELEKAKEIIGKFKNVSIKSGEGMIINFSLAGEKKELAAVNAALVNAGIGVVAITEKRGDIEDIYAKISAHEVQ